MVKHGNHLKFQRQWRIDHPEQTNKIDKRNRENHRNIVNQKRRIFNQEFHEKWYYGIDYKIPIEDQRALIAACEAI